jgi:nicotine blue oxidoreductase
MGTPKALIRDAAGVAWVVRTSRLLAAAGCAPVVVVVGAAAETVRAELSTEPVEVVEAPDWPEGMSASLRTGLTHLQPIRTKAAVVLPVDVPGLTVAAVNRVLHRAADQPAQRSDEQVADRPVDQADEQAAGRADDRAADQVDERVAVGLGAGVLARATYGGAPGHPVVIGRAHWDGVIASAHGDEGARAYLRTHDAVLVECADIADGLDADTPEALPPGHH